MRSHVGGGTCVEVPVVGARLGEAHGAERGGERVLVSHQGPHHGLVRRCQERPGRCRLVRLGSLLDRRTIGGQHRWHLLLGSVELLGKQHLLLCQLLLWARAPLRKLRQRRSPGAETHLNGPGPRVVEGGPLPSRARGRARRRGSNSGGVGASARSRVVATGLEILLGLPLLQFRRRWTGAASPGRNRLMGQGARRDEGG